MSTEDTDGCSASVLRKELPQFGKVADVVIGGKETDLEVEE